MTQNLLFPVLINASDKLFLIASRGNQATKFFSNLLNNFIQVVKLRILWAIYRSDLQRVHSLAPIVIALLLKEIHHGGLIMSPFFPSSSF